MRAAWALVFALLLAVQQRLLYGNDEAASKYSPLYQIHRSNVAGLRPVWEWKFGETPLPRFQATPGPFEGTPVMIDDVLYFPTSYYRVMALDADTGRERWSYPAPAVHDCLPVLKPPCGYLTAINLSTGVIAWHEVFGDTPQVRNHPALKGVTLPKKLGVAGGQGVIVTKGGLVFTGCGDMAFHAINKTTRSDLWTFPLTRVTGNPMTYRGSNGKQYVVVATGAGSEATLMGFRPRRMIADPSRSAVPMGRQEFRVAG
jgi:glucose dehydrogenase